MWGVPGPDGWGWAPPPPPPVILGRIDVSSYRVKHSIFQIRKKLKFPYSRKQKFFYAPIQFLRDNFPNCVVNMIFFEKAFFKFFLKNDILISLWKPDQYFMLGKFKCFPQLSYEARATFYWITFIFPIIEYWTSNNQIDRNQTIR